MTKLDRSPISRYRHFARWVGAMRTGRRRQFESDAVTPVGTMLPASANTKRKPWVVSQLPA